MKNYVNVHTRIARTFYKKKQKYVESKTLIDVILHNQDKVIDTAVFGCPFSDHSFVIAALDFSSPKKNKIATNTGRNLNEKNLIKLSELLEQISNNFTFSKSDKDVDQILKGVTEQWIAALDSVAPLKEFKSKPKEICPWEDTELLDKRSQRDFNYSEYKKSETQEDHDKYVKSRQEFQSLNRIKMKDYFASNKACDFKNNKLYREFYSSSIKVKSCKTEEFMPNTFIHEDKEISDPLEIGDLFNTFSTNLQSNSFATEKESDRYIDETFHKLKSEGKLYVNNFKLHM